MNPNHLSMKCNQLLIFMTPWVSAPIIRICKSTYASFVSIINSWRSDPGHLHHNSFAHHSKIYIIIGSLRPKMFNSPNHVIRTGQKSGMVVIRQFIHRNLERRRQHIGHMMGNGCHKVICIAQQFFPRFIAVLLHTRQKPGHRLHKRIIVHDRIPLISPEPFTWVAIMLRKNQRIWIGIFDGSAEFFPETMIIIIASSKIRRHIQTPSVYIIRWGYPFSSNIQNIVF